jgi:DNA anti-recombination protein RmuC
MDPEEFEMLVTLLEDIVGRLERVEKQMATSSNALDAAIAQLTSQVSTLTTQSQAIVTYLQGVPALITAAVNAALAAGATPTELTEITNLSGQVQSDTTSMASALNTVNPAPAVAAVTTAAAAVKKGS